MQNDVINPVPSQAKPVETHPTPAPQPMPLNDDLLKQVSGGGGLPNGGW
jgi:hypothetical protein